MVDSGPLHKFALQIWHSVPQHHSNPTKHKRHCIAVPFVFGGGWWIRTTEVSDNRFTVCPLWPLGKSPIWSW